MPDYNKKNKTAKCIDCGAPVYGSSLRCRSCRELYLKKVREEKRKLKAIQKRPTTNSMVIDGHVQVCKHMKDCFYGSVYGQGCSYASETGHTRLSLGLYIKDGKCDAYLYDNKRRKRRIMPVAPGGSPKLWNET